MCHLEGREVRWASGDKGDDRQHQQSTDVMRRKEEDRKKSRKTQPETVLS